MTDPSITLEIALGAIVYEWLMSNYPDVAEAIENAVRAGVKPKEIKASVLRFTGEADLALKCEQAARYLVGE
jgi:hypothetical protein